MGEVGGSGSRAVSVIWSEDENSCSVVSKSFLVRIGRYL